MTPLTRFAALPLRKSPASKMSTVREKSVRNTCTDEAQVSVSDIATTTVCKAGTLLKYTNARHDLWCSKG